MSLSKVDYSNEPSEQCNKVLSEFRRIPTTCQSFSETSDMTDVNAASTKIMMFSCYSEPNK